MSNALTTLDRQTATWALLCLANGDQYDVSGANAKELIEEGRAIAAELGVEIDVLNMELPE